MKTKLLCIILLLITISVQAQQTVSQPPSGVWSLRQCIEYALENNLTVQRGAYNVETSEVNLRQAKMAMLPSLNASANYGFNWGRSVDPTTNFFTTSEIRSTNPNANSSVTLFNGFRLQNTLKQNARSYEASKEDLAKSKNDVSVNIATLFITVVFNKEQLENAKFQLSSTQKQYERTKKQVDVGALPKSDELNLDAQVATNELTVIQQENALALSLLQLKQALQLPASTPFDVEVPEVKVEDFVLDQSRDQIYDIAKQTMPEIRSANLKVESAEYAAKAAKGNLYPQLSLQGSIGSRYSSAADGEHFVSDGGAPTPGTRTIGYVDVGGTNYDVLTDIMIPSGAYEPTYGYSEQLKDNIFRSAGLSLSIPIFNGLQSRSAYQRSVISYKVATIAAKETENTLRQNVETAYNDALAAAKTYNSSLRQVTAREEAFRMTQQRYEIGAANYVEYQVAENDLFRAKSDLVRAKYDFIFKKKMLDFYQGKQIEF
ncbi:MAG TPA: TolC family protein [Chryseolinea sp.]|nr:TolC family protein [Chryseolinea sp.]